MGQCANPFTPGAGNDPPYLAGREAQLRMFDGMLRGLAAGRPASGMVLYGLRGVGKTVLLGRFARACRAGGFLALARYQCGPWDSDPGTLAAEIKHALRSAVEPRSPAGPAGLLPRRSSGRAVAPAAGAGPGAYYEAPYPRGGREALADHLEDYLAGNWDAIGALGYRGAVLLLDEFHAVKAANRGGRSVLADLFEAVGGAQGRGCRYSLVLSGLPPLMKNAGAAGSRAGWMPAPVELSNLSRDDGRLAVARPLEGTGCGFSPGLVDAIVEDAGGYPYFVQLIASEVLDRSDRRKIGLGEYRSIRDGLIRMLWRDFFDQRMSELSPLERRTLRLVPAMAGDGADFPQVLSAAGCSRGALLSRLTRMEGKGIVRRSGRGRYEFALPLLGQYLASGHAGSE